MSPGTVLRGRIQRVMVLQVALRERLLGGRRVRPKRILRRRARSRRPAPLLLELRRWRSDCVPDWICVSTGSGDWAYELSDRLGSDREALPQRGSVVRDDALSSVEVDERHPHVDTSTRIVGRTTVKIPR